ncbi:GNAT family N-acetyltransferase [Pseudonocardia yunnanensis]|uniref:GNAT family N-acetyltransferase n=1 Tax=Pseudonocardia yunnanensis TaxID=58107 RepID=A0ABW4EL13_9PSEU
MTVVHRSETDRAVEILTEAFADDPVGRWLVPGDGAGIFYPLAAESAAAGELAFAGNDAVAVWLPVSAEEHVVEEFDQPEAVPERVRIFVELIAARHPSDRAHLYLPFLGVRPERQGRGLGGRLLADRLARADADGLPAYLEASSPRNAPLYERHGFRPTGDPIHLPDGPSVLPMWREPNPSRGELR